ncbi:MAG: hypothetical protein Ta2G_18350 [Termitinemataceae bacterium]|nr:MAG: hypothetical protein Ta2G_18350 [Termitinemataceae bacterium]
MLMIKEIKLHNVKKGAPPSELNFYDYEYESGFVHRAKRIGQNYYKYDLNGNLTAEQQEPFTAAQSQDHEVTRLDDNTYTSDYGWGLEEDGFGRTDVNKKSGRTYTWNEKNELSASSDSRYNVNYIYGEGGERTAKVAHSSTGTTSETLYFNKMYSWHYDGAISDYTGNYSKNIFLGETRILTKVNRADTFTSEEYAKQYWYHSDHLGSASLITDYQGREYERIEYTPYGELWVERKTPTDNLDTIFRFSGKELDAETGNYYYGARYLDPRTSRWLSTDPALGEYIPGAPINDEAKKRNGNLPGMGGVFNVVNFHLFAYAANNPVKYTDPDGKLIRDINKELVFQHYGGYDTFVAGRYSSLMAVGNLLANNGTPIEALQNIAPVPQLDTNCHGTTFADGKYWINPDQIDSILAGDGYKKVDAPKVGDVVIYRDRRGTAVHSAKVTAVKERKIPILGITIAPKVTVKGLSGTEIEPYETDVIDAPTPDVHYDHYEYYHQGE